MKKMNCLRLAALVAAALLGFSYNSEACTGISLKAKDGSFVFSRTMEWGEFKFNSSYVIVPRGHQQASWTPMGEGTGLRFTSKYGYVGIAVIREDLLGEGLNEKGLSAGLFYFPGYGKYEDFCQDNSRTTLADTQFLSWILGNFSTISEIEEAIKGVHIVGAGEAVVPGGGSSAKKMSVHWTVADATGRHVVIEIIDGVPIVKENLIGVVTNAPEFEWHMTNLNNYVHVFTGTAQTRKIAPGVTLSSIGVGSASLGLPGDATPPARFVRAAFYKTTAPMRETGFETVKTAFQILNNFDLPIGIEHELGKAPENMPSATQWTTSSDMTNLRFYYKTAWNPSVRCIDLKTIDFSKVHYQTAPVDVIEDMPVEYLQIR